MSYKNLDIWKLARELVRDIHVMTLNDLPKFEMYEVGSQIRRSAKSIKAERQLPKDVFMRLQAQSISKMVRLGWLPVRRRMTERF